MTFKNFNQNHPDFIGFPDPNTTDDQGLLGSGGNLEPAMLLSAYYQGIFPWFSDDQPILWWSPNPRMIIKCDEYHVSKSLRKHLKQKHVEMRCNTNFRQVMEHCASSRWRRDQDDDDTSQTWITQDMLDAYCKLHELGFAHSIECWQGDELVGGLYGISLGNLFFGESMFSKATNASKTALFYLCAFLKEHNSPWIDCQVESDHLKTLGAQTMSRSNFIADIKFHQTHDKQQQLPWKNFASFSSSIIL